MLYLFCCIYSELEEAKTMVKKLHDMLNKRCNLEGMLKTITFELCSKQKYLVE